MQIKEDFIEETQELALKTSKYIECNQRFATKREQFVARIIADVNKVNEENAKLVTDKQRLNKDVSFIIDGFFALQINNLLHSFYENAKFLFNFYSIEITTIKELQLYMA